MYDLGLVSLAASVSSLFSLLVVIIFLVHCLVVWHFQGWLPWPTSWYKAVGFLPSRPLLSSFSYSTFLQLETVFCTPFYFIFSHLSYPRRSATECEFLWLSKSYFLELKIFILVLSTSNPGRHPFIVGHVQGHVQCPLQQVLVGYFGGRGCPWLPENWRREWILRAATSAGKECLVNLD